MRKGLALLLGCLLLAGCAPASEILPGQWQEESYRNQWADIAFVLEEDFVQDPDTLAAVQEAVGNRRGEGSIHTELCLISADGGTGIMLQFADYTRREEKPEEAYLQEMAEALEGQDCRLGEVAVREMGGHTWHELPIAYGEAPLQRVLVRQNGAAMLMWTVTARDEEGLAAAEAFFQGVTPAGQPE